METNDLGREEVLIQPTDYPLPPELLPDIPNQPLTVENQASALEDNALRVFLEAMQSAAAKTTDKLRAAENAMKIIGKAGNSGVTLISAENAQINQINERPDLLQHLQRAGQGLINVTSATKQDLHITKGGHGT